MRKGWDGICSLAAEWAPLHSLCCLSGSQSLRDALKDLWFVERLTFGLRFGGFAGIIITIHFGKK